MRTIKLRAWDKEAGQMIQVTMVDLDTMKVMKEGDTWDWYKRDRVVMQYTGLQDKNGKEIYEGDILRFPPKDWREERDFIGYEVFYHDNDCADNHVGFQMNRLRFYGNLCGGECRAKMLPKYTSQMEIIGNIYENVDLNKEAIVNG